jgi:cytochrome c oxidase subunit 2
MLGASWVGFVLIAVLLGAAWLRRGRPSPSEAVSTRIVVVMGVVVPILVIATLFFISDVFVMRTTQAPAASATRMTVRVIGHDWWWEVRYPGTSAVTANEIHIPTRTPILLQATTADVIHSFWVPQLAGKMDTIPGQPNDLRFTADTVGRYLGQCAEFCGLQHAHMGVEVVVDSPADFGRWLARRSRVPLEPASEEAATGQLVFQREACAGCHTIRGTAATGTVGPDLTDVGSRQRLGADTLLNTPENMRAWIKDAQHFKSGISMPSFSSLPARDVDALVAYLESLR